MNKAHRRIEELYRAELRSYTPEMRQALGRRLEVDARFRAIENYLEFVAYDDPRALPQSQDSPDAAGTGSAGSPEATSADPPSAPLVGRPGASDEDIGLRCSNCGANPCVDGCALAEARACLRAALDDLYGESDDWQARASKILGDERKAHIEELRHVINELRPAAQQTKQAREERDRAAEVVAAARRLGIVDPTDKVLLADALGRLAKAIRDYDDGEIPF